MQVVGTAKSGLVVVLGMVFLREVVTLLQVTGFAAGDASSSGFKYLKVRLCFHLEAALMSFSCSNRTGAALEHTIATCHASLPTAFQQGRCTSYERRWRSPSCHTALALLSV